MRIYLLPSYVSNFLYIFFLYSYIYQLASASSQQQLDKYHTRQSNQPHSYNRSLTQKHVILSRGNQQQLQPGNAFFLT